MTSMTFVLTMASCSLLFLASVKANRDIILGCLVLGDILLMIGIIWYTYATDKAFKLLGESGTYPYPGVGYAYYTWTVFAILHFTGVLTFAWCKVFSKWIFGNDRPDSWVPPSQRGLLTGPAGGPPGPVPTGMMPPGPVPPGMAPVG